MRLFLLSTLLSISLSPVIQGSESERPKPCTIFSPVDGAFYDLNSITVPPRVNHKKAHKDDRDESWKARGYDYHTNFTVNFCAPVIEDLHDVVGVEESLWGNVSAFYSYDEKIYSIGQQSSDPIFRGRKLVLNYTSGSPCDSPLTKPLRRSLADNYHEIHEDEEDQDIDSLRSDSRRKSTIISFQCEHDPLAHKVHLSFVGATHDECTYFFEAKSTAACGGVNQKEQALGPGGVFGVIALIAAAVYLIGGIAYQRAVMHQRGWRQLPNYSTWAGIWSFLHDIFAVLTSSCTRLFPRRKGYNQLPTINGRGNARASREDENRLIDQLDEEWDD